MVRYFISSKFKVELLSRTEVVLMCDTVDTAEGNPNFPSGHQEHVVIFFILCSFHTRHHCNQKEQKQAGAELCQAQAKLGESARQAMLD